MRYATTARRLAAAGLLPLALSACSSAAPGGVDAAPQSPAAPAASSGAAAPDQNAHLLTGTRLKQALALASAFPAGYTLDADGSRDTGDTFVEPTAADVPQPDCTKLGGTSWTSITGIEGVSFAQNDYLNKNTSGEIAQEVDVYRDTTAQTVMKAVGMLAKACPSFTDSQTHAKVKVTEKELTGVGDGAYTLTLTSSAWKGGMGLVAARKGTAVVTVLVSSDKDNGIATAVRFTNHILAALPTGS
ncbi:hypothetical protein [Kitasatospora sp. NPDC059571]|uniref:hypothetical protein n=1 Tax=Kitasatospora sp. NPDC059571 TaxID=3346871 RepID=UPI003678C292